MNARDSAPAQDLIKNYYIARWYINYSVLACTQVVCLTGMCQYFNFCSCHRALPTLHTNVAPPCHTNCLCVHSWRTNSTTQGSTMPAY